MTGCCLPSGKPRRAEGADGTAGNWKPGISGLPGEMTAAMCRAAEMAGEAEAGVETAGDIPLARAWGMTAKRRMAQDTERDMEAGTEEAGVETEEARTEATAAADVAETGAGRMAVTII